MHDSDEDENEVEDDQPSGSGRGMRLFFFLLLAIATYAAGATVVAVRASKELKQSRVEITKANEAYNRYTDAILGNAKLKDRESLRKELLQPALQYYQSFVQEHSGDDKLLREVTLAQLHLAAVEAKSGSKNAASSLVQGVTLLGQMADSPTLDPQTLPSAQEAALKYVPPMDWIGLKVGKAIQPTDLMGPYVSLGVIKTNLTTLSTKYPQVTSLRDDAAGAERMIAVLTATASAAASGMGGRPQGQMAGIMDGVRSQSQESWREARKLLEKLVQDVPGNADYKSRLAEALMATGKNEKAEGKRDEAIASYTRAVELREELAKATPHDETLKKDLATAQSDLTRLKASAAKKPDGAAAKTDAAPPATEGATAEAATAGEK